MKLNIGDTAWVARAAPVETWVICPDCCGQKALTIIFGDGTQASIECENCKRGYEPPRGVVVLHEYKPVVEPNTITGMDQRQEGANMKVQYWSGCSGFDGENAFATIEEAQARANELMAIRAKEEKEAFEKGKYNRDKTWAWNASYHRKCLKEAQRNIEYHTAKLNVAKAKSKEPTT